MPQVRKLWWTRLELRREIISLINRSHHPCSMWVIEHALKIPQPSLIMPIRIERELRSLIRSGIVERVTDVREDKRTYYLYRIAEGIALTDSSHPANAQGEPS